MSKVRGGDGASEDPRANADQLRLALEASGLGTFRWDMATGVVEWDERMEVLFGFSPGEFDGTYDAYIASLHPDDRDHASAVVQDAVEKRRQYRFEHRVVTQSGEVRWLEGAGGPILGPDGEVTGLIGCTRDITDHMRSREGERHQRDRLRRVAAVDAAMASLARDLSGAQGVEQAIDVLVREAPAVSGATRVDVGLLVGAATLELHLREGALTRVVDMTLEDGPFAEAVATAAPVVTRGDDAIVGSVVAPLFDDTHDILGVLAFHWDDEAARAEAVEDAVIETVARLCGQTLRRTLAAERVQQIAELAANLATARARRDVAENIQRHGEVHLGADLVNLRVVDQDSGTLLTLLPTQLPEPLGERFEVVRVDAHMPLSDAVRAAEPIWLADREEVAARYPEVEPDVRSLGFEAMAALPLRFSDGRVAGAIAMAWSRPMRFTDTMRSTLITAAALAAQTLERCTLHEAEHAVVAALQRRLLAPLPDVPGVDLAARYEPAAGALGMGGDWYEAFVLEDGTAVAVLGDVVGHGVAAVAAMAQLQHLAAGLLKSGTPLHEVLAQTSSMLAGPDPIYATAQLLHIDPKRGVVGYQNAGHPWALLRKPEGTIELLDRRHHGMLGTTLEPAELDYVDAPPRSLLLSYTDGLIERRHEAITDSIDRLGKLLAEMDPDGDLDAQLGELIEAAAAFTPDDATNDDIAALLIRLR